MTDFQPRNQQKLRCCWYESNNTIIFKFLKLVALHFDTMQLFLISNFCRVLNVVCFLLGDSPASEFYMPTFRNTLSVTSS